MKEKQARVEDALAAVEEGVVAGRRSRSAAAMKDSTWLPANTRDLAKAGVVDPTKVTRMALQNAASISALMLTTEALVTEMPEKEKPAASRRRSPGFDDLISQCRCDW